MTIEGVGKLSNFNLLVTFQQLCEELAIKRVQLEEEVVVHKMNDLAILRAEIMNRMQSGNECY